MDEVPYFFEMPVNISRMNIKTATRLVRGGEAILRKLPGIQCFQMLLLNLFALSCFRMLGLSVFEGFYVACYLIDLLLFQ